MIREVARVVVQVLGYSIQRRSVLLPLFVIAGLALVLAIVGSILAAPILIYPLL